MECSKLQIDVTFGVGLAQAHPKYASEKKWLKFFQVQPSSACRMSGIHELFMWNCLYSSIATIHAIKYLANGNEHAHVVLFTDGLIAWFSYRQQFK